MPATKIKNVQEVLRWFEEGRTYTWMIEEYRRKYDIETTPSLWGGFRRRRGLPRRITRDDTLIPWFVREEHRWEFPIQMLRAEARRRSGAELDPEHARKLRGFLQRLEEDGTVVHYEPDTDEGFFYVARRDGVDADLIREPEQKTTPRPRID
jgi:hypothetical protein